MLRLIGAVLLGIGAGWVSAIQLPQNVISGGAVSMGPWQTAKAIGVEATNPYVRAWVARHGIWALPRSEVIYLSADTDSSGAPLKTGCRYLVTGEELPSRWWSVTAYRDDFWMDNPLDRYSVTSTDLGEGTWQVLFSSGPEEGAPNWLPMDEGAGPLNLTLRLYDPEAAVSVAPETIRVPEIRRLGCS